MKSIDVIIPVHNEEQNLRMLAEELLRIFAPLKDHVSPSFIFVDDGSTDASVRIIEGLAQTEPSIRLIEFSRNFGKEIALTAGIHAAKGDAAIMIDADLQHPPSYIPEFIRAWEAGADMVVGIRDKNPSDGFGKRIGSKLFYAIMSLIGSTKIVPHATDFRLIDRKVIDEFNRFTERNRMTRGLLDWMGFKRTFISFKASDRKNGDAQYGTMKLIKLALSAFISHSLFPLKLAGYLGMLITTFSGCFGVFILIEKYALRDPLDYNFSGPAILAVLNTFLIGIVLSCLGLIALYIANIHEEVVNRPMYIVRRKISRE